MTDSRSKQSDDQGGLLTAAPLVLAFLGAILGANLAVQEWGQPALLLTAWILIPFDMLVRDVLHRRWESRGLWAKMLGLVSMGSVLTYLVNQDAGRIALASTVAFACAMIMNTVVYAMCGPHTARWFKMNVSNLFAATVDSLVFPFLAFDDPSLMLCAGQAGSKFLGGVVCTLIYLKLSKRND